MKGKNRTAIKKQQQSYQHLFSILFFFSLSYSFFYVRASVHMSVCVCGTKQYIYMNSAYTPSFARSFVRSLSLPLLPLFLQCQCSLTVHTLLRLGARVIEHTLIHIYNNDGHHSSVIMFFFFFLSIFFFFVESHRTI